MNTTKLHLGCGSIYLKNYINIDVQIPNHYLAKDRQDIVDENITTFDKYYDRMNVTREEIVKGTFHKKDVAVDLYNEDFLNLPFEENTVDEIRLVQVFEHFTFAQGEELMKYFYKLLKKGGILHIDVPDLERTIDGYHYARSQRDKDWFTRLLFGSQKNKYAIHQAMYNPESLKNVFEKSGFKNILTGKNIHFYPAFSMEGVKI